MFLFKSFCSGTFNPKFIYSMNETNWVDDSLIIELKTFHQVKYCVCFVICFMINLSGCGDIVHWKKITWNNFDLQQMSKSLWKTDWIFWIIIIIFIEIDQTNTNIREKVKIIFRSKCQTPSEKAKKTLWFVSYLKTNNANKKNKNIMNFIPFIREDTYWLFSEKNYIYYTISFVLVREREKQRKNGSILTENIPVTKWFSQIIANYDVFL